MALALVWALAAPVRAAQPAASVSSPPAVNLLVEWRSVEAAPAGGGYSVSTRSLAAETPQAVQLLVRNGQPAVWRLNQSLPVQWTQGAARGAGGAGAVAQGLFWLQAGQALWVRPLWPGAEAPVQVDIRVEQQRAAAQATGPLPAQHSQQASSSLLLPLGVWTTFASSGATPSGGGGYSVSTQALGEGAQRSLQLRVSLAQGSPSQ